MAPVTLPTREGAALARIAWDRLLLKIRGLELPVDSRDVPAAERARLDAMWNLAAPVGCLETLPAAALTTRHLRASLAAGDRAHAARALAQEACLASIQELNNPAAASRLFARARTLYEAKQNPALESWTLFNEGSAAGFQGDYVSARTKLETTRRLL